MHSDTPGGVVETGLTGTVRRNRLWGIAADWVPAALVIAGSIVLAVACFMPWFEYTSEDGSGGTVVTTDSHVAAHLAVFGSLAVLAVVFPVIGLICRRPWVTAYAFISATALFLLWGFFRVVGQIIAESEDGPQSETRLLTGYYLPYVAEALIVAGALLALVIDVTKRALSMRTGVRTRTSGSPSQ